MCHTIRDLIRDSAFIDYDEGRWLLGKKEFEVNREGFPIFNPVYFKEIPYQAHYYRNRVEFFNEIRKQKVAFFLPVVEDEATAKDIEIFRVMNAGMHISPVLLMKDRRYPLQLERNEFLVQFSKESVVFFDGHSVSVSHFSLRLLDPKLVQRFYWEAVDEHNRKLGILLTEMDSKYLEKEEK